MIKGYIRCLYVRPQIDRVKVVPESEKHGIHVPKFSANSHMGPVNLNTKFCLLNWSHLRWPAIGASSIWHSVRRVWLDRVYCFKWRQSRTRWFVGNRVTASDYASAFAVTWTPRDNHVNICTNQSPADVLRLSPCVNVKLIHVDGIDRKLLMHRDLNTGVYDPKTKPAHLAILNPPPSPPPPTYDRNKDKNQWPWL